MTAAVLRDVPTWEALADLYGKVSHDDEAARLVLDEARRRENLEAQQRERDAERGEWESMALAQYAAAEAQCNGYLIRHANRVRHVFAESRPRERKLNPDDNDAAEIKARRQSCATCGHALRHPWHEGTDPFILWEGTEEWARKYASEELCAFWDASPRVTVTQYREQISNGKRIQRDQRDAETTTQESEPTEGETVIGHIAGDVLRAGVRTASGLDRAQRAQMNAEQAIEQRAGAIRTGLAVRPAGLVQRRQPPPIDGARLLTFVKMYLARHVSFPDDASANVAVAWVVHSIARHRDDTGIGQLIWRASPRLLVTSKTRGSGKSTLLDLILILSQSRRGKIPRITPAKFAKVVGKHFETVVLDEAKTIFGAGAKSLELQGVLLAGYTPRASYEVSNVSLPLFSAVAYAGKDELITETSGSQIGDLLDRSVILRLRPPSRPMPEIDEQAEDDGEQLGSLLIAWTDSVRAERMQAARDLAVEDRESAEDGANLRAIQISRPLRACGRIAGGDWEDIITSSLRELTEGSASEEMTASMDDMERRFAGYAAGAEVDDEPGRIVQDDDYDEED